MIDKLINLNGVGESIGCSFTKIKKVLLTVTEESVVMLGWLLSSWIHA